MPISGWPQWCPPCAMGTSHFDGCRRLVRKAIGYCPRTLWQWGGIPLVSIFITFCVTSRQDHVGSLSIRGYFTFFPTNLVTFFGDLT